MLRKAAALAATSVCLAAAAPAPRDAAAKSHLQAPPTASMNA